MLAKEDHGAASESLVVKVDDFPEDWWAAGISFFTLLVALFQLCMFRKQLGQMDKANEAAKDAADAARPALNAGNPPKFEFQILKFGVETESRGSVNWMM